MEERGAAHRTDLAVAEEAAQGNVAQLLAKQVCVVIRLAEKKLAPAQA